MQVTVEVSPGELIDKLTILQIKSERITDADKLRNVRIELEVLTVAAAPLMAQSDAVAVHTAELKRINEALWEIEDDIRDCEAEGRFDQTFIELARAVYVTNDRRSEVKKKINLALGSRLVEEKSYKDYTRKQA